MTVANNDITLRVDDKVWDVLELQIRIVDINAELLGMVAENELRTHHGESPAYLEGAFEEMRVKISELALKLREMNRGR